MRLALTHPYSWPEVRRGGERILAETAHALATRGHDVTVLTAGAGGGRHRGGGVTTLRLRRRWSSPTRHEQWFAARVAARLARGGFDVVHSLMPRDAVAAMVTARLGGHRTVYQDLGIPWRSWVAEQPDARARRRVVAGVDAYACISRFVQETLSSEWGRAGVLVPPGVRLDEFTPAPTRAAQPTLLFTGALDVPRKGVAVLLEALAVVAARLPDVRLWLNGPGDAAALLRAAPAAARDRTQVLPLGDPGGQAERYGQAWLTVHPAMHESFGMVLVESLACGTPVVAADHAALPELVVPGTGVLCDPADPGSVAGAIEAGLALAAEPGVVDRCRAIAAAYDWDTAIAPRLEAIYRADAA